MTAELEPTAQTLTMAKEHLLKYGWQQGRMGRYEKPCCISGAIRAVTLSHSEALDAEDAVRKAITKIDALDPDLWDEVAVTTWNDEWGRTQEDVLKVLDAAIELTK